MNLAEIKDNVVPPYVSDFLYNEGFDYANRIFYAILILVIGYYCVRFVNMFTQKVLKKAKIESSIRSFLTNIIKALCYTFIVIAALSKIGIDTTSMAAAIAAAGLAIGLSLQNSLSNFAAGVMIVIFKFFRVDDFIQVADIEGTVEEISILTTTLIAKDNREIIIPNSQMISGHLINYSKKPTRRVDIEIAVSYEENIKTVQNILLDILAQDPRILADPKPDVVVGRLDENAVHFYVRPWVLNADYWPVKFDLLANIKTAMDRESILTPWLTYERGTKHP
ncbi:MAG: mechanosensitive ion channel [Alphaproteobacteria bacterium]|jgi:small conductance mechanosensitive channel|nr:mechanosensitive ion channel [Alphaproteobacteria bacterium]MBP9877144.1 mechanosensitive ion channel [Alphaproteobacteria bacterium]